LATVIFYLAYICIVVRVLISGQNGSSITRVLLWLPAMVVGAFVAAISGVLIVSVLKEVFELGGGTVDWMDVDASIDGAMTIVPFVGLIMAVTPLFIPLDILMQLPRLMITDMKTGIRSLDDYVNETKLHNTGKTLPDVLLVEDDIDCAAIAMSFCRNFGLKCHHVSTASEAKDYLYSHTDDIRLVLLDNFLRVDEYGCNMTGSELLLKINEDYPINKRHFAVVMLSGHTELFSTVKDLADCVMQKPWSPAELAGFLKEKSIISVGVDSASKNKIFSDNC